MPSWPTRVALVTGRAAVASVALVVAATASGGAGLAWGYDFSLDVRTIGQGYQVRRYAPTGATELLTRRRLTQYLNLSVFNMEPKRWRDATAGRDRNSLFADVSLRFDSDFGGYTVGRPTGVDEIRELHQSQVDILYAYLGGRDIGGRLDFQIGRQVHFDLVDFYSFDGVNLAVGLVRPLRVEVFSGTEVRGELPLSAPLYELDGTSVGSQDPATRPNQARQLRPLAGAALALDGWEPLSARLAYRRIWSATADRLPGEPGTGTNDEKLSLTGYTHWRRRVYASAGVRYDLLTAAFDDQQMGLRVAVGSRHWLFGEHAYLAPTFDGDSIWNVFSAGAYRDLRGGYEVNLREGLRAHLRGFFRMFEEAAGEEEGEALGALAAQAPGGVTALGGSAGASWRGVRGSVRGDGYWEDGYGGRKLGGMLSGRYAVKPRRWEVEGRLTGFHWKTDLNPAANRGVVFGVQAGARYEMAKGMRLHFLAEDNLGTFYVSQYRALALVELDVSL